MLQNNDKEKIRSKKIREQVEQGILPKANFARIQKALQDTKKPNVLDIFGFLSAKKKSKGVIQDLGLVSVQKVTQAFATYLVDSMQNSTTSPMDVFKYHASGTDNTAESNTQTALGTEVETRSAGTTEEDSSSIYKTVSTLVYTGTHSIVEHGVFSASSGGTMLDRSVITAVPVENTDEIEWTYKLTVSAEA